jgi:urease accessory protein
LVGLDHILAMVLVGAWSMMRGGKLRWAGPAMFLVGLSGGIVAADAGLAFGGAEHGVAASVLVFGLFVAALSDVPAWVALCMFAFFGAFHGQAHVTEVSTLAVDGRLGFGAATALLHLAGAALAAAISREREAWMRGAGFASACCGIVLFAMVIV